MADSKVTRPIGRPRVDDRKASISAWISTGEYDRLVKMANQREQSLSSLVRDLLKISRQKTV